MRKHSPGLLLAICIAMFARFVSGIIPGPGDICWAILIGILCANLLPLGERVDPGLGFAEKKILPLAIALMGSELQLHTLGKLGFSSLLIVLPVMLISIFSALLIGRRLKLSTSASLLLGIGNSVCGSSAVLAAAPALKAEKHDTAAAVAAVNVAGTIGMFVLPALAVALSLSDVRTSYLIGGSLQAVGQVVAAGFSVSNPIGNDALVIKMLRVLMIGPIVMVLHLIFHSKTSEPGRRKKYIPGYIIGFICCAALATVFDGNTTVLPLARTAAKLLMVVAMAGVGCRIHLRSLLAQGPKAMLLVGVLSVLQAGLILLLCRVFTSA